MMQAPPYCMRVGKHDPKERQNKERDGKRKTSRRVHGLTKTGLVGVWASGFLRLVCIGVTWT